MSQPVDESSEAPPRWDDGKQTLGSVDEPLSPEAEDEEVLLARERRRSRRGRMRRPLPGQSISHLNLTPMMDIMTILLVFLVKSFASEPENINVNLSLQPPVSTSLKSMEAATKVMVTAKSILVDDKEVMALSEIKREGEKIAIPQLRQALQQRADHLKALENRGGTPFDGRLLVVAHETTKYEVITAVLVTAGESKFSEYKLVVMQKAGG